MISASPPRGRRARAAQGRLTTCHDSGLPAMAAQLDDLGPDLRSQGEDAKPPPGPRPGGRACLGPPPGRPAPPPAEAQTSWRPAEPWTHPWTPPSTLRRRRPTTWPSPPTAPTSMWSDTARCLLPAERGLGPHPLRPLARRRARQPARAGLRRPAAFPRRPRGRQPAGAGAGRSPRRRPRRPRGESLAELAAVDDPDLPVAALVDGTFLLWGLAREEITAPVKRYLLDEGMIPALDRLRALAQERPSSRPATSAARPRRGRTFLAPGRLPDDQSGTVAPAPDATARGPATTSASPLIASSSPPSWRRASDRPSSCGRSHPAPSKRSTTATIARPRSTFARPSAAPMRSPAWRCPMAGQGR